MRTRTRITIGVLAIGVTGSATALGVAAAGHRAARASGTPKPIRHVEHSKYFGRTVAVRQVDPRRGLIFELEGSEVLGGGLEVTLAARAPRATRDAVQSHPLAATCTVPGHDVHEFAGRWDRRLHRFGTALDTADPELLVADAATSCALYVGREGGTPDTASFDGPPFSRVRMR